MSPNPVLETSKPLRLNPDITLKSLRWSERWMMAISQVWEMNDGHWPAHTGISWELQATLATGEATDGLLMAILYIYTLILPQDKLLTILNFTQRCLVIFRRNNFPAWKLASWGWQICWLFFKWERLTQGCSVTNGATLSSFGTIRPPLPKSHCWPSAMFAH